VIAIDIDGIVMPTRNQDRATLRSPAAPGLSQQTIRSESVSQSGSRWPQEYIAGDTFQT
jgi:hypothetical protein